MTGMLYRENIHDGDPGTVIHARGVRPDPDGGAAVLVRVLKVGFGLLLVVAGLAMLVLPGPGLLTIAIGAALMLSQWPRGRRTLARVRVKLRERYGSRRVRRFETCIPDEVCPPHATAELRELASSPIPPPPTDDPAAPRPA
jgi:hypothetical protein